MVRTPGSHPGNRGSTPLEITISLMLRTSDFDMIIIWLRQWILIVRAIQSKQIFTKAKKTALYYSH